MALCISLAASVGGGGGAQVVGACERSADCISKARCRESICVVLADAMMGADTAGGAGGFGGAGGAGGEGGMGGDPLCLDTDFERAATD